MTKKYRLDKIIEIFKQANPSPKTELNYNNGYELLVAVMLSAQCTDKRVNLITPPLFKEFPTPEKLSKASIEEVFDFIRSCSYPNNKSKHLVAMANMLVKDFNQIIPRTTKELEKLPGVGRKTANVISAVLFNKGTIPVDTHVFRVTQRIGLVNKSKSTLDVEKQLLKIVPENIRPDFHHWIILHGRYVCKAINPICKKCEIKKYCLQKN